MSSPCGCTSNVSTPYTTPVYTSLLPCTNGTTCDEIEKAECIKYTGPNLSALGVTHNMTLKEVLVALNMALSETIDAYEYTITVTGSQTTTVVEYISNVGALTRISVGLDQSPQTICAQEDSPVKLSGTGVLSEAGASC